jgi:hypothetical protein
MKNGENRALAKKMDRMEGKMDRIAKKKDKKNSMEKLTSHVKISILILFFIGFI